MNARIYGYKNHTSASTPKHWPLLVSDASVHDSQRSEDVLDASSTASVGRSVSNLGGRGGAEGPFERIHPGLGNANS
jgi:hypothetical protein